MERKLTWGEFKNTVEKYFAGSVENLDQIPINYIDISGFLSDKGDPELNIEIRDGELEVHQY